MLLLRGIIMKTGIMKLLYGRTVQTRTRAGWCTVYYTFSSRHGTINTVSALYAWSMIEDSIIKAS